MNPSGTHGPSEWRTNLFHNLPRFLHLPWPNYFSRRTGPPLEIWSITPPLRHWLCQACNRECVSCTSSGISNLLSADPQVPWFDSSIWIHSGEQKDVICSSGWCGSFVSAPEFLEGILNNKLNTGKEYSILCLAIICHGAMLFLSPIALNCLLKYVFCAMSTNAKYN